MCFFAWHYYERNVQPLFAHSLYKFKHIRVVMTTQISVLLTFLSSASWWDRQRLSFHSGPEAVTLEHIDWLFDPILPPPPPRPTPLRPPSLSARTWRAYKFRQKRGSNNTTVQYVPKPVPYTWPHCRDRRQGLVCLFCDAVFGVSAVEVSLGLTVASPH
jgi:hypothetical protein